MKLSAATVVTATVLAFAFPQTPPVLAEGADVGAASRPFPLNDGSSPGAGNRGQSHGEQSQGTERSGDVGSEKSQTGIGNAGKTSFRGHRVHRHGHRHVFALNHPRHHLLIHRRGHRVAALNEPGGV
jgi:hypothetical protein